LLALKARDLFFGNAQNSRPCFSQNNLIVIPPRASLLSWHVLRVRASIRCPQDELVLDDETGSHIKIDRLAGCRDKNSDVFDLRALEIEATAISEANVKVGALLGNAVEQRHFCVFLREHELETFKALSVGYEVKGYPAGLDQILFDCFAAQVADLDHFTQPDLPLVAFDGRNHLLVDDQLHRHLLFEEFDVGERAHELERNGSVDVEGVALEHVAVEGDVCGRVQLALLAVPRFHEPNRKLLLLLVTTLHHCSVAAKTLLFGSELTALTVGVEFHALDLLALRIKHL
jgi:hypothetical protein